MARAQEGRARRYMCICCFLVEFPKTKKTRNEILRGLSKYGAEISKGEFYGEKNNDYIHCKL